jgi:general secretion pathway protein B
VSLILDALRKADAERERGSVPSLHSQPVAPLSAAAPPKARARPNWLWIAIGIAVGLAGAATWVMVDRDGVRPRPAAPRVQLEQPVPSGVAPGGPSPAAAAPSPPVGAAQIDEQPIAEPAPWRPPEERKAPRPEAKDEKQAARPASAPAAEVPVVSREQLPPDIRAGLPQLTIGGSMYSTDPASRSLIINGQLYREKDRLTEELSLEEIKLKSAVFKFRGHRFEVLF